MELFLTSTDFDDVSTQGNLSAVTNTGDVTFRCFTLELPFTDGLPGSAIPAGRFQVVFQPSPKFERSTDPWVQKYAVAMPHIIDIPNRSLIMFHWGNDVDNTDGCVLIGNTKGKDFIGSSRAAFVEFYSAIFDSVNAGQCFVTVKRDRG
jgi:Family of unknown function (DUF5675)